MPAVHGPLVGRPPRLRLLTAFGQLVVPEIQQSPVELIGGQVLGYALQCFDQGPSSLGQLDAGALVGPNETLALRLDHLSPGRDNRRFAPRRAERPFQAPDRLDPLPGLLDAGAQAVVVTTRKMLRGRGDGPLFGQGRLPGRPLHQVVKAVEHRHAFAGRLHPGTLPLGRLEPGKQHFVPGVDQLAVMQLAGPAGKPLERGPGVDPAHVFVRLMDQRLQMLGGVAELPAAIQKPHRRLPLLGLKQLLHLGVGIRQVDKRRHLVDGHAREREQPLGQVANVLRRRAEKVAVKGAVVRGQEVLGPKQQLVMRRSLDVLRPQRRIDRQGTQGQVDHQGREVVQIQREVRGLVALRVLVGLHADFQVAAADQGGNAHAVVVDQLQITACGDHHVGVLQIAVGDPRVGQLPHQLDPAGGRPRQGLSVSFPAPRPDPVEQRLPLDPVHDDQRVPLAVPGRADALVAVLEVDQAVQSPGLQIPADQSVPLSPLG